MLAACARAPSRSGKPEEGDIGEGERNCMSNVPDVDTISRILCPTVPRQSCVPVFERKGKEEIEKRKGKERIEKMHKTIKAPGGVLPASSAGSGDSPQLAAALHELVG
uniref:Uncharacterized protein n=1 Tax=Oryza glumipatula TaxID=40148 RepID=A0A0D9YKW9_9ORYZ